MLKNDEFLNLLYFEYKQARDKHAMYVGISKEIMPIDKNYHNLVEYYKRLAEIEWNRAFDILEIIYDFEHAYHYIRN